MNIFRVLLQSAAVFALLCLSVCMIILAHDAHRLALDTDKAVRDLEATLQAQGANLSADEMHLDLVLDHLDGTISQLHQAAVEERTYWLKTSADSDKTVKALRLAVDRASLLLDHTDKQLNGALLPDIDRELQLTSQSAQMSIASLGQASDILALQLNDPAISQVAEHLNDASKSVAATADHLDKATADIERDVHRLTKPPSLIKQIGMVILDVAAKLGSVFAGFVR